MLKLMLLYQSTNWQEENSKFTYGGRWVRAHVRLERGAWLIRSILYESLSRDCRPLKTFRQARIHVGSRSLRGLSVRQHLPNLPPMAAESPTLSSKFTIEDHSFVVVLLNRLRFGRTTRLDGRHNPQPSEL